MASWFHPTQFPRLFDSFKTLVIPMEYKEIVELLNVTALLGYLELT